METQAKLSLLDRNLKQHQAHSGRGRMAYSYNTGFQNKSPNDPLKQFPAALFCNAFQDRRFLSSTTSSPKV